MSPIRVLLVDDHPIVRSGIRHVLEKDPGIEIAGEASGGNDALRLADELQPDVLLLDMELPDLSGSEVARRLQVTGSKVRVLALSGHAEKQYIQGLLSNGASGYLLKDEVPNAILDAVHGVARGELGWISRQVAAILSSSMMDDQDKRKELSEREMQVLEGMVQGKSNKDIALTLSVDQKTVEKHITAIFNKLGVSSRVEAAVYAVRQGWFKEGE